MSAETQSSPIRRLLDLIPHWAEVAGALGVILYALGWLFVASFYSEFGVAPEEVGISFQWLVLRVAVVILAIGLVAFLPTLGFAWILSSQRSRIMLDALTNLIGLFWAAAFVFFWVANDIPPWRIRELAEELDGLSEGSILLSFFGIVFFVSIYAGAVVATRLNPERGSQVKENLRKLWGERVGQRIFVGILGVVFVAAPIVMLPWSVARQAADQVRGGDDVIWGFEVGLDVFRIQKVEVLASDSHRLPDDLRGACAHLLGQASGVTVLYDQRTEHVWRVSTEAIALRRGSKKCQ